jgi:predicted Zn-dependent protease
MELVHLALISNDRKRAGALMSKWLVNKPDDAAVRMKYASFLSEQDDRINAIAQLEILVKRAPNNIDAINNLAWLIQDKDPMRAQALLSHALKLSPNSAHAADTLGWLKLQRKDISGALALLSRAHQMQPANPTITYHLIVALDAGTKRGEALTLLKPLLSGGAQFADRPEAQRLSATWLR